MNIIQQQTAAVYGYKNKCHWLPRLISAVILHQPQHSALVLLVHSRTHYPEISWLPLQSANIMVFLHIYITSLIIAAVADTVHILIAVLLWKEAIMSLAVNHKAALCPSINYLPCSLKVLPENMLFCFTIQTQPVKKTVSVFLWFTLWLKPMFPVFREGLWSRMGSSSA